MRVNNNSSDLPQIQSATDKYCDIIDVTVYSVDNRKKVNHMNCLQHPFGPLFNEKSHVLILGSFPSVKSREQNFFYGHPQNRFWKTVAAVFGEPVPQNIEEKKQLILNNGLALWDSIASCEITGSSDASIRNARANDIGIILDNCNIERIYCNGRKSHELYCKYIEPKTGRKAICLPSTSPANAQWTLDKLIDAWSVISERGMTPEGKKGKGIDHDD